MEHRNPFGIEDEGKTAGLLSYFFVLGWSMAFFTFHQYEKNSLSSFHLRQTLLLYLVYLAARYGLPLLCAAGGLPVAFFATIYFIIPVNALFIYLWGIGLSGAMKSEETPIPVLGDAAQKLLSGIF